MARASSSPFPGTAGSLVPLRKNKKNKQIHFSTTTCRLPPPPVFDLLDQEKGTIFPPQFAPIYPQFRSLRTFLFISVCDLSDKIIPSLQSWRLLDSLIDRLLLLLLLLLLFAIREIVLLLEFLIVEILIGWWVN